MVKKSEYIENEDNCQEKIIRDVYNERINDKDNQTYNLFTKANYISPRPCVNICNIQDHPNHPNKHIFIPPLQRPLSSHCHQSKLLSRSSHTKHDLSYSHLFTDPCLHYKNTYCTDDNNNNNNNNNNELIWNHMTNRKMSVNDCYRNNL